jgi:hypothetical protein
MISIAGEKVARGPISDRICEHRAPPPSSMMHRILRVTRRIAAALLAAALWPAIGAHRA